MRYFTNRAKRLSRTIDDDEPVNFILEDPMQLQGWREVESKEWDRFNAETAANFSKIQLRQIRAGEKTYAKLTQGLDGKEKVWILLVGMRSVFIGQTKAKAKKWASENDYIVKENLQ